MTDVCHPRIILQKQQISLNSVPFWSLSLLLIIIAGEKGFESMFWNASDLTTPKLNGGMAYFAKNFLVAPLSMASITDTVYFVIIYPGLYCWLSHHNVKLIASQFTKRTNNDSMGCRILSKVWVYTSVVSVWLKSNPYHSVKLSSVFTIRLLRSSPA